jgi:hypothetical protein
MLISLPGTNVSTLCERFGISRHTGIYGYGVCDRKARDVSEHLSGMFSDYTPDPAMIG